MEQSQTLQIYNLFFGLDSVVAIQDPAYPVYIDSNVIAGRTGGFIEETGQYEGIVYMPCTAENNFFPEMPKEKVDIMYICSPNNPTAAVSTKEELQTAVDYANDRGAIIIFDAAYAAFIQDPGLPRSILEIPGAKECAIEINSFSKSHGYTGTRLGWTVIPKETGRLRDLWVARQNRFFNEASNVVQPGGIAALTEQGLRESQELVDYYMDNAFHIKDRLGKLGLTVFGGENAPYVWMKTPDGMPSWDFFDKMLEEAHVVGTPGAGFGPSGEGYFRLSAFGHKQDIKKAVKSILGNLML